MTEYYSHCPSCGNPLLEENPCGRCGWPGGATLPLAKATESKAEGGHKFTGRREAAGLEQKQADAASSGAGCATPSLSNERPVAEPPPQPSVQGQLDEEDAHLSCRKVVADLMDRVKELEKPSITSERITTAAKAFVEKLHAIHADEKYQSVWAISQIHVGPYQGPNYIKELEELEKALHEAGVRVG